MQTNSESIYATGPSPFAQLPWGRCTTKPGKLFLHVFNWPADGKLEVPGLHNKVTKAYLLSAPSAALDVAEAAGKKTVALPAAAPDAVDTVLVLELEGPVNVAPN